MGREINREREVFLYNTFSSRERERERERVKIIRTRRVFGPDTDFRLRMYRIFQYGALSLSPLSSK